MKSLNGLLTAALLLTTGCASTPEQKRMEEKRNERADRVEGIVHEVGTGIGLSPLQRTIAERKARQIAGSEDPLKAGLEELDKNPKLERKVGEFLEKNKASDVLGELGRENPKLKAEADELLRKNPGLAKLLGL
ncbi:hypothetical protein KA050_01050 [Candidatus Gracilibacteria bacterium]|nr:hypothetical protein [Candidatus Gracilibacteria bacterium]